MINRIHPAALLILGSSFLFASMGALIKMVSPDLGNPMVVFFRNAFGLLALSPWLWQLRIADLRSDHLRLHLIRDGAGLAAMACFFYAIPRLDLASAMLLNYSAPLFIPFIAWIWLKERVKFTVALAVPLGFIGLLMILKPTVAVTPPALIGLLSGLLAAVAMVGIRRMAGVEPPLRTVFYFSLFSTLVSGLALPWGWQTPAGWHWLALLGIGGLAAGAQMLLTMAYNRAPAAQTGTYTYLAVLFGSLYGWIGWHEQFDVWSLIGMALVIGAAAWTSRLSRPVSAPPQQALARH
jgi:drug/metabolite transporter (DMT)-like permease